MAYVMELDDRRLAIPRGTRTITVYAKTAGASVHIQGSTTATARVYDRANAVRATSTVNTTNDGGASHWHVVVDATTYPLDIDYRVEVSWSNDGRSYVTTRWFDVCARPFDALEVLSLNDLSDVWPDIAPVLERQAEAQDATRTAEQQAQVLLLRAWEQVSRWIRKRVETDGAGRNIAALLVDDTDLRPCIVYVAIALAMLANGDTTGHDAWMQRAQSAWQEVPSLRFDESQDGTVDTSTAGAGVVTLRRSR
jgi:hypothetical protein